MARIIAVVGPGGGTGRSTTALHLGHALNGIVGSVRLVEASCLAGLSNLTGLRQDCAGLVQMAQGGVDPNQVLASVHGVAMVPVGRPLRATATVPMEKPTPATVMPVTPAKT